MKKPDGDKLRFTFAGSTYFNRMKQLGLYTTDKNIIANKTNPGVIKIKLLR